MTESLNQLLKQILGIVGNVQPAREEDAANLLIACSLIKQVQAHCRSEIRVTTKRCDEVLHLLRNPYGHSEEEMRQARLYAANVIEEFSKVESNTKRESSEELHTEIRLHSSRAGELKESVLVIPVATAIRLIDSHLLPARQTNGPAIGIGDLIRDSFFEGFGVGDTQASEKTIEGFWEHSQAKENIPPLLQGNSIEDEKP